MTRIVPSPEAERLHRHPSCRISLRPPPPLREGQERFLRALVNNESTEQFKLRMGGEPWFRRVVWGAVVRTSRFWIITLRAPAAPPRAPMSNPVVGGGEGRKRRGGQARPIGGVSGVGR